MLPANTQQRVSLGLASVFFLLTSYLFVSNYLLSQDSKVVAHSKNKPDLLYLGALAALNAVNVAVAYKNPDWNRLQPFYVLIPQFVLLAVQMSK